MSYTAEELEEMGLASPAPNPQVHRDLVRRLLESDPEFRDEYIRVRRELGLPPIEEA